MSTLTDHGDPAAAAALHQAFPDTTMAPREWRGDVTVEVQPAAELDVLAHAKEQLGYELLIDRLGADRGEEASPRFEVITILYNLTTHKRLHVLTALPAGNPETPTAIGVFRGANWFEREIWDMYGVKFSGHPNLERILMMDVFPDHPLRKEYPTEGAGEFAAPKRALGGTRDGTDGQVAVNHNPSPRPEREAPDADAGTNGDDA